MINRNIGFAFCGSYCTFEKAIGSLKKISQMYENVTPLMSENAYGTDTKYGTAQSHIDRIEALCKKKVISTIRDAEPFGPKALIDIFIIAPCTGNTLAKLSAGITDSSVTMAAKANLRNNRPVLIAVSTNDGLSGNASNIGKLLNRKNIFFVPFYQDDPLNKPCSLVADFDLLPDAAEAALRGVQLQPLLCAVPSANN